MWYTFLRIQRLGQDFESGLVKDPQWVNSLNPKTNIAINKWLLETFEYENRLVDWTVNKTASEDDKSHYSHALQQKRQNSNGAGRSAGVCPINLQLFLGPCLPHFFDIEQLQSENISRNRKQTRARGGALKPVIYKVSPRRHVYAPIKW